MSREKQKIISDICPHHKDYGSCEKCREDDIFLDNEPCYYECMANEIIKNNYVKQSEGKWITYYCTNGGKSKRGRTIIYKTYTCDACGKSNGRHKANFCPHCGARMKGE